MAPDHPRLCRCLPRRRRSAPARARRRSRRPGTPGPGGAERRCRRGGQSARPRYHPDRRRVAAVRTRGARRHCGVRHRRRRPYFACRDHRGRHERARAGRRRCERPWHRRRHHAAARYRGRPPACRSGPGASRPRRRRHRRARRPRRRRADPRLRGLPHRRRHAHRGRCQSRRRRRGSGGGRGRGRRRLRVAAHRISLPRPRHAAVGRRTGRDLPGHRAGTGRAAVQDPHLRHRRRQAAALSADAAGGESGARPARHPGGALAQRSLADPARRHPARGAGAPHHAADDRVAERIACRPRRVDRDGRTGRDRARHHDRDARLGGDRRPLRPRGRFLLHRHQRSHAVHARDGSRPCAARPPDRRLPSRRPVADRAGSGGCRHTGEARRRVRRPGRRSARRGAADRAGRPRAFHAGPAPSRG